MAVADPFADPIEPPQFSGDTLLERVSRAHEEACDAWADAIDDAASAENAYLAVHSKAWAYAVEDGVAATVRDKHCNAQPDVCEARQAWNRAVAAEKRYRVKASELENRLTAVMAHQRFIREAT